MNAFERRIQITERMRIRKLDTVHNLAFEFGVSRQTMLNDIAELTVSGYPIQTEPGRGGGVRWIGGKRSFPFTKQEVASLHNAMKLVEPEDRAVLENLLRNRVKTKADAGDIFGIFREGQSQRSVAKTLGVSESHLSRVLSGRKKPSEALAQKILALKEGMEVLCER